METANQIENAILGFLAELLAPGMSSQLSNSTRLRTSGIIDSMDMLRLIAFLEERFQIEIKADEADGENLDRIQDIVAFIQRKQAA